MVQDDIPGVMGAPGGPGGRQGAPGGLRGVLGTPQCQKRVIKQQNNGPKPWFKVPKVCPDPKGMVLIHFSGIWDHLGALKQRYLVKTPICQKNQDLGKFTFTPLPQGTWSKKWYFFEFLQLISDTKDCWKNLKNQNHLAKFGCGSGIKLCCTF